MKRFLLNLSLILTLTSCSNAPEMETGEIKALQLLKQTFSKSNPSKQFIDARELLTRQQIDTAKTPVLFVELASGQNGTLIPYPGQGVQQTWLGADGATITMDQGVLTASRGLGNDLMGSVSSMPPWSKIKNKNQTYSRELLYITGNNQIFKRSLKCNIQKTSKKEIIKIWDINFKVAAFEENCRKSGFEIKNIFYVDSQNIVRRSSQYHSDTIGFIHIERLDR